MREYLLKNVKIGDTVKLYLNNNKEIEGEVVAMDNGTYLYIGTADSANKPIGYNIIGDVEIIKSVAVENKDNIPAVPKVPIEDKKDVDIIKPAVVEKKDNIPAGQTDAVKEKKDAEIIKPVVVENKDNISVGQTDAVKEKKDAEKTVPANYEIASGPDIYGYYTGFITKKIDRPEGFPKELWIVVTLDGTTFPFSLRNIKKNNEINNILYNQELWQTQSVKFKLEKTPKNKIYAGNVQIGERYETRPEINPPLKPIKPRGLYQLTIPDVLDARELFKNKEYKKALELYKTGLEKAKNADVSYDILHCVKNIIKIYLSSETDKDQYENCLKAEKLLFDHKKYFLINKYYAQLIRICEKLYKLGYEDKLLNVLDEAISEIKTKGTIMVLIVRKAYLQSQRQDKYTGSDIVDTLNKWIITAKSIEKTSNDAEIKKIAHQQKTILNMAAGYISKIKLTESDYVIPSPLKEAMYESEEARKIINAEPQEKGNYSDTNIDQSWNILFDDPNFLLSSFVRTRLEECNLREKVRINMLDNEGRYIGTIEEAISKYKNSVDNKKISVSEPVKRSEEYLTLARVLYDALQNQNSFINEAVRQDAFQYLFTSIGKSLVSFGDYAVKDHGISLDTARYYYFEGLKYISDEKFSQDLKNAAIRLNLSFFLDRSEIPLPSFDQSMMKTLSYTKEFPQLIAKANVKEGQINEFINFILQMLSDDMFPQEKLLNWLLTPVSNSNIGELFFNGLAAKLGNNKAHIKGNISDKIIGIIKELNITYNKEKQDFVNLLKKLEKFSFSAVWLSEIKGILEELDKFRKNMLKCDIEYLDKIKQLVSKAAGYNDNSNCDTKAELIDFIIKEADSLKQTIKTVPTKLAFENIFPLTSFFRDAAEKEYAKLCENNPPKIEIKLFGEEKLRSDEGKVVLDINVFNLQDSMTAYSLTVFVENGEGFSVVKQDSSSPNIRGGESRLFKTELQLNEKGAKILTSSIIARYTRKKTFTDEINEEKPSVLTVTLTNEKFNTIDNPYSKYSGGTKVIDEKMFFGREEYINGIISHLMDSNGNIINHECILLYGQTRTGKSSILWHLNERIKKQSPDTIIVDFKEISAHSAKNIETVFPRQFLIYLSDTLKDNHKDLFEKMKNENIVIPEIGLKMPESEARAILNDFLYNFNRFIGSKPDGREHNIVVMIDEFTAIYGWIQDKKMDDDFMVFWKAFINNNGLIGILAGKDTMPDFIAAYPNPFAAIRQFPVTYLPETETERMIKDPPARTKLVYEGDTGKNAVERIKELTAGSAWFNMKLLSRLVDYMNEERRRYVSDADIEKLCKERIFSGISCMMLSDFDPLYNDGDLADNRKRHNLAILYGIATTGSYNGSCKQNDIRIDKELKDEQLDDERIDSLIKRLIDREVLERDSNENLKIKVGLFYEWLTKYCSPKQLRM